MTDRNRKECERMQDTSGSNRGPGFHKAIKCFSHIHNVS